MTPRITLDEFRAARLKVDDLSTAVPPEFSHQYSGPGFVYPGDLVIELSHMSDDYCLTIGNLQVQGPLDDLEERLYYWAVGEEITGVAS